MVETNSLTTKYSAYLDDNTFYCLLIVRFCVNRHKIHELEQALTGAVSEYERIDMLNELAMLLLNTDVRRVLELAEEALRGSELLLDESGTSYLRGIAVAKLVFGGAHYRHSNNELALQITKEAVELCEHLGELRHMTFGLNTIGATYITLGEYNKALETHQQSLRIRQSIGDDHGAATSQMNIGNVYYLLGDFDKALDYYVQSLTLRKRINDYTGIGTSLANIGNVYSGMGDSDLALEYLLQSAEMKERTSNKQGLSITYCDIAAEYLKKENTQNALQYARKSHEISLEIGNKIAQSSALDTIAKIEELLGNTLNSLEYHKQSLQLRKSIGYHKGEAESLLAIGTLQHHLGATGQALITLQQGLSLAEQLQSKPLMYQAHNALADCYEHMNLFHEALQHHKQFHSIKEQIYNEDSTRKTKNLQVLHNLEKAQHEAEIYRLRSVELTAANNEILRQQQTLAHQTEEMHRSNQELTSLNQEKDELLGIVAHDLKNPLTGILINVSNIRRNIERMSAEDVLEQMNRIEETTKRMHSIAMNLLDVHSIEAHAMHMAIQTINIGEHIKHVTDDYDERANEKQIALHIDIDNPMLLVRADKNALRQVLDNLVSNAIKYSPYGKEVTIRCNQAHNDCIRIEIQDQGHGIPEHELPKLFKKYSKLSNRPTGGEQSTGLGLSIVKKLTEAMHGSVWCDSSAQSGATFVVELPAARQPNYSIVIRSARPHQAVAFQPYLHVRDESSM
ncbi:MAG: tetratricopeptide repeat protein [Bacteriodetes bacterium]|nr:tetratricopeptide repeat protein [Bacteroidota bacterium]